MDSSHGDWYDDGPAALPDGWRAEVEAIADAFFEDALRATTPTEGGRHRDASRYAGMIAAAVLEGTDGR